MGDKDLTLWLKLKDEASGAFKGSAKVIAAAAVAIGVAVGAAGIKLFKLGSDAEEADNVIGLAFGSMKQQAIDWSAAFKAATGSSKFESRELAADLGLIIRGMGFTEQATFDMSTQMVELAADMSSAKNVPLALALDKIRAGLIGESEPLRTMGVLLSEARVKQVAYAEGIAATGAELTIQEKVQARMHIILVDSIAMHGDLINTQESSANQWRAIGNVVFDAATTFGKKLLPAFNDVLGVMRTMVDRGVEVLEWLSASEDRMDTLGAIMVGAVVAGVVSVTAALWLMVPAVTAATGGLNLVLPAIVVGLGLASAAAWKFRDDISNAMADAVDVVSGFVLGALTQIHKLALLEDKIFGTDFAAGIADAASAVEQFRVDAGGSLRVLRDDAGPPMVELADMGYAIGLSLGGSSGDAPSVAGGARVAKEEVDAFLSTIEGKSAALDHWGLQLDGIGQSVDQIPPFLSTLTGTIEDQSAAVGHWGLDITQFGQQLDLIPLKAQAATEGFLDNITSTFAAAFTGGGGFLGGLQSVMTQGWGALFVGEGETAATGFLGKMQGVMGALGGVPLVGPLLAAFGPALIGGISKIWSSFGPSEAELAARKQFAGFHKGAVEALGETQKFADEVQVAINQGWDTTLAETRAGFILFGTDAGLTYDQAFADYERYQQAVGAGNTALMEQIEADYARYREASEEANEAASRAWESASNAAVSAFRASEDAGVSAYDEIFEKAIESGHGQEEAVAQATAAQLAASAEVIAAKREEYAFDAAMNAAMSLGANATAEERKSAARDAATVARESWGAAMDAVADSDQAASDAMNETWDPESGDVVTDTRGAADAIVLKMEQAERDLQIQFEKMSAAAGTEAQSIESSFNSIEIKDQSFTIREHRQFSYSGFQEFGEGGPEGRQHGGPVGAGQSVIVGEAGPEIFTPGRSGSVTSNRSIPSAEEIGAAVARAMQRAPLVVPRDAVTDAVLGNSPSRQALAGYQ